MQIAATLMSTGEPPFKRSLDQATIEGNARRLD